jgi:hypothetical protein
MKKTKKNVAGRAVVWMLFDGENNKGSNGLNVKIAAFYLRRTILHSD